MSYWCAEKLVVRIAGPEGEREVTLDQPFAQIGTHSRGHIVLNGPGVRKRALLLLAVERGIYCAYLDIEELRPEQCGRWLKNDEAIQLGPYTLTARLSSGTPLETPGWNPLTARGAPPIPVVHVYCGPLLKDRRRLRHPLTLIGRRPQCSLRLRGEIVSSFHSLLYWCDRRLWCLDLISSNGTRFGAEIFSCRELQLGERVEVGEFSLLYYRWSPRGNTPGAGQINESAHDPIAEALDASFEIAEDLDENEGSTLFATPLSSLETELENEEIQNSLAAQQAELVRQRSQLEQERSQQVEEFKSRHREIEAELWRVVQEREALAASKSQFDSEREALAQQLQEQRATLERIQLELADAQADQAPPEVPATEPQQPEALVEPRLRAEDSRSAADTPETPDTAPKSRPSPVSTPTVKGAVAAGTPAGRRKTAKKDDPTSFVSGRLGDLEFSRRWRSISILIAIGMAAVATAAAGFGWWFWLR